MGGHRWLINEEGPAKTIFLVERLYYKTGTQNVAS